MEKNVVILVYLCENFIDNFEMTQHNVRVRKQSKTEK